MGSAPRMVGRSAPPSHQLSEFCSDVMHGPQSTGTERTSVEVFVRLEVGSALFDVICMLPEYGLARAGMRMLARYRAKSLGAFPAPRWSRNLGSGSGQQTRWLLEALARRQRVNYYPIDISGSALFRCQQELGQMDRVSIVGFERAYLDGFRSRGAARAKTNNCSSFFWEARLAISTGRPANNFCAKYARF